MNESLIKQLKMPSDVEGIFFERQKMLLEHWQNFVDAGSKIEADFETQLVRAISYSVYVFEHIHQAPEHFLNLVNEGLYQKRSDGFYQEHFTSLLQGCDNQQQCMKVLRQARNLEMLRFIWREVNQLCSLQESAAEISAFATAAIDVSLRFLYQNFCSQFGEPLSAHTQLPQTLSVLGMGKLGGNELNLSSDIDLIFFYQDSGRCAGSGQFENQQFFTRLAQQLIRVLDERTADGIVFRVDMRLRPYGESGLLVLNQDAMEQYYETQGRTWERYAFIKAKCIAGNIQQGEDFLEAIRPFIYRKYVDFSVLESLREMKLLINRQVVSKGLENDIKLGGGGIRETEFIVQALQLIQGGRKPRLQQRSYYTAMQEVLALGLMNQSDVHTLVEHYTYYRRIEHLLQGQADKQTQMLPADAQQQNSLAWVMGENSFADLMQQIQNRRQFVRSIFDELFSVEGDAQAEQGFNLQHYQTLWLQAARAPLTFSKLEAEVSQNLAEVFSKFAQEKILSALSESEKKRIDWCMAYLVYSIENFQNPLELLEKTLRFLRAILKRSVYLVLLSENPKVFDYLLSLFQRSEWVLDNLLQHPFLLDELLQLQNNKKLAAPQDLADELYQLTLRMDAHDLETVLEELRVFKCTCEMKAAALYLDKDLNTSDLGDYLSALAEVMLNAVCRLAIKEVCKDDTDNQRANFIEQHFAVLAYGKLGSREFGFGSDMDLVFVFNNQEKQEGDIGQFLTRYAQKIIHLLTVRTYSGILYEVDMRLRPSGKSGPLVSSLEGFERYQQQNAWTWEHQALVKARMIVGSDMMRKKFSDIRAQILGRQRDCKLLLQDMKTMLLKLRDNSPAAKLPDKFHLKSDAGGIVDIEFLAQFLVLSRAHEFPDIMAGHATLEIFNFAESEAALKPHWLPELRHHYFTYRRQVNELTLAYQKVMLDKPSFEQERASIQAVWQNLFEQYALQ